MMTHGSLCWFGEVFSQEERRTGTVRHQRVASGDGLRTALVDRLQPDHAEARSTGGPSIRPAILRSGNRCSAGRESRNAPATPRLV